MVRMPVVERRRLLTKAAFRVMARDGVASTTVRAIVTEAGMSLGAFHYCFRSKAELLEELIGTMKALEVGAARDAFQPGQDFRAAAASGLRAYWALVESDPGPHRVLHELTQHALCSPGLEHVARDQYDHYRQAAAEVLHDLADGTGMVWSVPLPIAARMLVSLLDGLTLSWLVDRDGTAALAVLDAFADHLTRLVRPATSPPPVARHDPQTHDSLTVG